MILLIAFTILSILVTGLYVYFIEYLKNGVLYYTIPIVFIISFIALIILLIIFLYICLLFRPKSKTEPTRFYSFFTTQVAMAVSFLSGVKVIKENFDLLPNKKFLFVSNHQSLQDPVAIIGFTGKQRMTYIMKDGIMKIPFVGRWLYAAGFLPIDRKNDRNALKTIITAGKRLREGHPIAVFPEGTRSGSKNIGGFRNGIFKIAQKVEAPIVVCLVDNFYAVRNRFPLKRTKALIRICEVIPYEDIKDLHTNEIGDKVRDILIKNQEEARVKYSWIK